MQIKYALNARLYLIDIFRFSALAISAIASGACPFKAIFESLIQFTESAMI